MEPGTLAALVAAFGGGTIIQGIGKWAIARFTGRDARTRDEVSRIARERDAEYTIRRVLQEALAHHRRIMIEAPCIDVKDIPPYPSYSNWAEPAPERRENA